MAESDATPVEATESSTPIKQRGIVDAALLASFIIYLIGSAIISLIGIGLEAFVYGFINFIIAIPFAFAAVLIYRKAQLPSRFELLMVLFVSGPCVIIADLILLYFLLSTSMD